MGNPSIFRPRSRLTSNYRKKLRLTSRCASRARWLWLDWDRTGLLRKRYFAGSAAHSTFFFPKLAVEVVHVFAQQVHNPQAKLLVLSQKAHELFASDK